MQPTKIDNRQEDIFKSRLSNELNPKHEMMILSRLIPWDSLEVELVEWCGMWKEKLVLQKIFQKSSRQF